MIPLHIITGFLGSGKTTILNSILYQLKDFDNIVIENEFGKVNIDSSLIQTQYNQVFELTNGCICCSLDNELWDILFKILKQESRPNHVFIETSGIADPLTVIDLISNPKLKVHFNLKHIITIVDAENYTERAKQAVEFGKQIACATTIIINKVHQFNDETLTNLNVFLAKVNPFAKILIAKEGKIKWADVEIEHSEFKLPIVHAKQHTPGLNHVSIKLDPNIPLEKIVTVLKKILQLYSNQVFRIKGIVKDLNGRCFSINSTGLYIVSEEIHLNSLVEENQLVFIGLSLKQESMLRFFNGVK
jgi:G3E family GTPase